MLFIFTKLLFVLPQLNKNGNGVEREKINLSSNKYTFSFLFQLHLCSYLTLASPAHRFQAARGGVEGSGGGGGGAGGEAET